MFTGVHALIYAKDAERARAFFRDVLALDSVDAGHGWLIFALPPAEVGIHPVMDDGEYHQLYLMCRDVHKTVAKLEKKGVQCAPIQDAGFGLLTSFEIPGGGPMGMYQPKHPTAIGKKPAAKKKTAAKKTVKKKRAAKKPAAKKPAKRKKR